MIKFEPLINFTVDHDYFEGKIPGAIFRMKSEHNLRYKYRRTTFPIIQKEACEWELVGDKEQFLEYLKKSPDGLNWQLPIDINDPGFSYYTDHNHPDTHNDPDIQISNIHLNHLDITIHVSDTSVNAPFPINKKISYHSKEAYWEYILIPRNLRKIPTDVVMEDRKGGILFEKAERFLWLGHDMFRVPTVKPIKMREPTWHQRTSDIVIYEQRESLKRIIAKNVPVPEASKFLIKELLSKENSILQILYI